MPGYRAWIMTTAFRLCPPPGVASLRNLDLAIWVPVTSSVGMHNTQQMSLAMEVSETTVLTQVASSTHVGRDTQVYEGKPHWDRPLALWKHLAFFIGW